MLSLFQRTLCCVIALQMVLTPLYGAASAAAPVVMVSDTKAQGLLTSQVIALSNINIKLLELNNAQKATNETLTKILGAIKYQPPAEAKDIPTTDIILAEFSSSLYAAYTSDSIAYTAMKEAKDGEKILKASPAAPQSNPSEAPAASQSTPSMGQPTPSSGAKPDPFKPAPEESQAYYKSNPTDSMGFGPNDPKLTLNPKQSDVLGNIADITGKIKDWTGNLASAYYNLNNLQNCGNAINCASSGLNTVTGILKTFNIQISGEFNKTLGYIGAGLSFVNLVANSFSGKLDVGKVLQFINGMQQNILFASLAKGGLLMDDSKESKIVRIISNLTTLIGYGGLKATLSNTDAIAWITTLNNFSQIGAATRDTPKTGSLSTDTPLAGINNPVDQPPTTEQTADFLRSMLDCNRQKAKTLAQCEKMKNENKWFILGQLKSRCAAAAMSKEQIPAKMFQELFLGTSNPDRCKKTALYKTKDGKELCPSITALQAASMAESAVSSQLNVLIGLSMYNLVMANVNTEQVILQNACNSLGDLIEKGASVQIAKD